MEIKNHAMNKNNQRFSGRLSVNGDWGSLGPWSPSPLNPALLWSGAGVERVWKSNERNRGGSYVAPLRSHALVATAQPASISLPPNV